MSTFVALYRGPSVSEARLVAVSSDAALIRDVATRLIGCPDESHDNPPDPVIRSIDSGRRHALRRILQEASRV